MNEAPRNYNDRVMRLLVSPTTMVSTENKTAGMIMGKIHIPMKRGTQRGAILLTSLVLLAVLTMVGHTSFLPAAFRERMAGVAH